MLENWYLVEQGWLIPVYTTEENDNSSLLLCSFGKMVTKNNLGEERDYLS